MTISTGIRAERQILYTLHRPYYGYTLTEWRELKDKPNEHKQCSTCIRVKAIDNFISQYSGKPLKICHFCQNRGFHKYHIDGYASVEDDYGICDTRYIMRTGNHMVFNFRLLDLSKLKNKDPRAIYFSEKKKLEYAENRKQKVTCNCGAVVSKGSLSKHKKSNKCKAYFEALNKKDSDTESTACSENSFISILL